MKYLIFLGFIFLLENSFSQHIVFKNKEDEKESSHEIFQTLIHLTGIFKLNKITKDIFVEKVKDGIVNLDEKEYTSDEIKILENAIKYYVKYGTNPRDKELVNDLGFDSGVDTDLAVGELTDSDLSKFNIKIDSTWVDQESTTMIYLSSSDIVYKKGSNVPVSGVIYKLNQEKNKLEFTVEYMNGKKHGALKQYSSLGFMDEIENYSFGKKEWAGARYSKTGMAKYLATNPDSNGFHFVAEYFPESKVESSLYNYLNGKKHGRCVERYTPNQMKFEGEYDDGKRIGVHKYWYSNGKKEMVINYAQDKYHGLVSFYFENGQIKSEGKFINGKKDGTHLEFFENGQLKYKQNYKNEKKNGLFEYYYKNGQLQFQGNYLNGLETGLHKRWYEYNGQLREVTNYVNGKIQGKSTSYYENGNKSAESETIINTRTVITWHSNGTKSYQGTYIDNKKEGVHYEWYKNGILKSQITFKLDKKNGVEKVWYENGNLKFEKKYLNDIEQY